MEVANPRGFDGRGFLHSNLYHIMSASCGQDKTIRRFSHESVAYPFHDAQRCFRAGKRPVLSSGPPVHRYPERQDRLRSLPDQCVLPVLPAARYGVHGGCAGRGRKPDLHLYHRGRDLLCGCFPLRSGGRRHHGQHPQAAGGSFHLPQGRHSVRARRPLPHLQPVPEKQHHPLS